MEIRNPIDWGVDQFKNAGTVLGTAGHEFRRTADLSRPAPMIRRIRISDLRDALTSGMEDFGANRTDVLFLCIIYPLVGLFLARVTFGYDMLPLLFPLASGFALIGPVAALGLYEMSRRREMGIETTWMNAIDVLRSPSLGSVIMLGMMLCAIFLLWVLTADLIYSATLGPGAPDSASSFARNVFTTEAGWTMIGLGVGVGFLFAAAVLAISVVSFPLLLDRHVSLRKAVRVSVDAVLASPGPMAVWGMIVAGSLVLGSIPLFLGLIVVLPVLGHSTWHLYRKVIVCFDPV
ncbi:hypothetical protein SAE02_68270 [Skermanella aerolata]|uniref:Cytochrome b6 n=1 Tax=Skermanella aerolata TaxID=393310 RepID=A0A512E1S3_9PROT|nr:DUF2189 domain-containing protein [Skermanella aerolata]KJB91171.1 cytochrome C oxidase subunit I [Skermanella aerolata KACC 11604]GEO42679.1 hypothetical protein SAE02_68270 [Skermanella aerolata]